MHSGAAGASLPPMKRGEYAKTAERRRTILATALEVFAGSGFRGASIREIASRVGMTDTGVLHHFGGKGKLLLAVVTEKEQEDVGRLRDPYLRDLVARNATRPGTVRLFTTLSAEATDPEHPAHEHFVDRYETVRRHTAERLTREQAEGLIPSTLDPAVAARLMMAVMDGLQIQWLLDPSLDMDAAYNDFIAHYFGAEGPTGDWVPTGRQVVVAEQLAVEDLKDWMTLQQAAEGLGVTVEDLVVLIDPADPAVLTPTTALKDVEAAVPGFELVTFRESVRTLLAARAVTPPPAPTATRTATCAQTR